MIKLTRKTSGDIVIVNPRNIEFVYVASTSTVINMVSGQEIYVSESIQQISNLLGDKY